MEFLEKDFTAEEIEAAIRSFSSGKTPGPDGLPGEWYRAYATLIAPKLLQLYADCKERLSLTSSMSQAHIVLIPKPGKDKNQCASYRQISLLNYDFKILTKILATRLQKILPSVVNINQTGFVQGKSVDINLRKVFTHIHLPPSETSSGVLVALDIEKAFDLVAWSYMLFVLETMEFGIEFRRWIDILYRSPMAQIKLGGALSSPFAIGWGMRQGCPLSPALFALVMEPLASAIRQFNIVRSF